MIVRQLERIQLARMIDAVVVATSTDPSDDALASIVRESGFKVARGSLDDVLDRFAVAARDVMPEHVVRLTGDCPLVDPDIVDAVIAHHLVSGADITSNSREPTFPDGLDVEVMRAEVLFAAAERATKTFEREHVTPFIYDQSQKFHVVHYRGSTDLSGLRWTVDEPEDLTFVREVYGALYPENPGFRMHHILQLLAARPELSDINSRFTRNAGLARSIAQEGVARPAGECVVSTRYGRSEALLKRAQRSVPLGAQTFSKSVTQFPFGVSPYFAKQGKGARLWDVDGNEYVDFVNALCAVTLGYADPDVNAAVAAQLGQGTLFTLSHELEADVAERIIEMVPCAEMVRFGKNGSDATAGAIRVARAATGRDHVLVCGYHGWQDWYIGSTTRDKGVPAATSALTHKFAFNDLASVEALVAQYPRQIAAIILEPMNVERPTPEFLGGLRKIADRENIVLIFDETITGFRFAKGGAQELFGVTPDLATLGKGLANGFPLSAVCGRADLMREMSEVFFSFTMGGETLSLAAAKASLEKIAREPVIETMRHQGARVTSGLKSRIAKHGVDAFCQVKGDDTWSFFILSDVEGTSAFELKTLWMQEMFARGVLSLGTHNMSYAHGDAEVGALLAAYDEVLPLLRDAVRNRAVRQYLKCEPLAPLFKVR